MIGAPPLGLPTAAPSGPTTRPKPEKPEDRLAKIPEGRRHRWERVMFSAMERIEEIMKMIEEFLEDPDERPPFMIELTAEEQLQRFYNAQARGELIAEILTNPDAGPDDVKAYLDKMIQLSQEMGE